jgi:HD-GYP domain-containing protein (c-di-GMP phosphodiesterase class II)
LIDRDADVALFLCVRQEDRRFALYPLRHSIHCAVLAWLTARHLGWEAPRCASLGCAAVTMNLSMFELQAAMAEQDTPPTRKQLEQIRGHPDATVALLRGAGVDDEEWLSTIAQHHEHAGAGYPRGLTDVSEAARILRAADVYMASISAREKRPPVLPQAAARQLFQRSPGDPFAMAMIKTLGIHPPGSLVQLQSGEIGVSIRRPAAGVHPLVATLSDRKGRPHGDTHRRDTSQPEFTVQAPLPDTPAFARVLPERVYGLIED